jgi:hypothetical protein
MDMNRQQFSIALAHKPSFLRAALLYEAGFTLAEIARRERTNHAASVQYKLNIVGIEMRRKGPPELRAVDVEIPKWRQALHERLRGFGLTAIEASWLLSINRKHVSTLSSGESSNETEKPKRGKGGMTIRGGTCNFRFALSARVWLEIEDTMAAVAFLDGASVGDIRDLAQSIRSARNFTHRVRNVHGIPPHPPKN